MSSVSVSGVVAVVISMISCDVDLGRGVRPAPGGWSVDEGIRGGGHLGDEASGRDDLCARHERVFEPAALHAWRADEQRAAELPEVVEELGQWREAGRFDGCRLPLVDEADPIGLEADDDVDVGGEGGAAHDERDRRLLRLPGTVGGHDHELLALGHAGLLSAPSGAFR